MENLKKAIKKYLESSDSKSKAASKAAITRIINARAKEVGTKVRDEALTVINEFEELPEWMKKRFALNSIYIEGDRVFGWWNDGSIQIQAEELPINGSKDCYIVSFYGRENERSLWESRGFKNSENLPLQFYSDHWRVEFPIEKSILFLKYGYALPCPLQWHWNDNCYEVNRSIITEGFWQAWKWWENSRWWYLERRPELFGDLDWWEENTKLEIPDKNAAILGKQNREFWEKKKISGVIKVESI